MIGLTINVTEPEYIEAQSLYHRASRHKRIRIRGQLAVICLLSIWGVISLAWKAQLGFNFLMALLAPAWFILAILSGLFKKSRQYSAYKLAAVTLNGVQVEIDEAGYRWHAEGRSNGTVYWPAFTGWMETSNTFVLIRGALLYILQKSAFSPEASAEFRDLCLRNVGAARQ
jgi:hypothetical protein